MKSKIIIFLVYLVIAVIFTFPLILNLSNHIFGWPLDGYLYYWNIYSFWHQIFNLKSPFFTNSIFYPIGANLLLNSYAPLISIVGVPFLKNPVFFINSLIIISVAISAFAAYLLVFDITKNRSAAFISGLFYGASPIMVSFLISEHYYFAFAAPFIPMAFLLTNRFIERGNKKFFALVILVFWLTFFTDNYTSILLGIVVSIYFLSKLLIKRKLKTFFQWKKIRELSLIIILEFILPIIALLYFVFGAKDVGNFVSSQSFYPALCSAKPAEFIIPSSLNPLLGQFSAPLRNIFNVPQNLDTPYYFLGWFVISIIVINIFTRKNLKKSLPFYFPGILIFLISLGPKGYLFNLFSRLPFMGLIDCPQRLVIGVQIAASAIIGIFIAGLLERSGKLSKLIITSLASAIFIIEYGTFGIPITKIDTPTVYKQIALDKNNLTVLELPSGLTESKGAFGYDWSIWGLNSMQMYWQTIYQKPRIGGYVSRINEQTYAFFKTEPIISDLFIMTSRDGKWDGKTFSSEDINNFISKFNIGYIVLSPNPRQTQFSNVIELIFKNKIFNKTISEGYILYKLGH